MKRETAERLAATAAEAFQGAEHVTVEQVRAIIGEFLAQLVRCPACDEAGTVEFGHDANVLVKNGHDPQSKFIPAGSLVACPRCGGRDEKGRLRHDPEFVGWFCTVGEFDPCSERSTPNPEHVRCGYRIMLSLPEESVD